MNVKKLTFAGILVLAMQACLIEGKGRAMKAIAGKMKRRQENPPMLVENEKRILHSTQEIRRILVDSETQPSVLIIGAGSAGIGAAEKLVELGITDFKIIEATGEIGGRLHVENLPKNITDEYPHLAGVYYEVGGNWIHGYEDEEGNETDHPLIALAKNAGLRTVLSDYEDYSIRGPGGEDLTDEYDERWEVFEAAMNEATKHADEKRKEEDYLDISLQSGLSMYGWSRKSQVDHVVEWSEINFEFADESSATSLVHSTPLPTYTEYGEYDHFIADPRGYQYMFEHLFSSLNAPEDTMIYNQYVTHIDYSDEDHVIITANSSATESTTYEADYAIVTTSLGPLQNGLIEFTPNLPSWKVEMNHEMHLQSYVKVVAVYAPDIEPFWSDAAFEYLTGELRWTVIIRMDKLTDDEAFNSTISSHVVGYQGENMIHMTDEEIRADWITMTRRVYGADVPEPIFFKVPRWEDMPIQGGAYSNWPVGLNDHGFELLRDPLNNLFFGGEHTSIKYNGYVHGGYLSGHEAATAVADCIAAKATGKECFHAIDNFDIHGCTYEQATNYNSNANEDDGSCVFSNTQPTQSPDDPSDEDNTDDDDGLSDVSGSNNVRRGLMLASFIGVGMVARFLPSF